MKGTKTYVSGVLEAAKARLTPETWGRAESPAVAPPTGKLCVVTALSPCNRLEAMVAVELLHEAVFGKAETDKANQPAVRLTRWNDLGVRTLADVHAAYDTAIALEHAQR